MRSLVQGGSHTTSTFASVTPSTERALSRTSTGNDCAAGHAGAVNSECGRQSRIADIGRERGNGRRLREISATKYDAGIRRRGPHDEVDARARGYQQVWLIGMSLGGIGTLYYARAHTAEVTGILALAR